MHVSKLNKHFDVQQLHQTIECVPIPRVYCRN